MKSARAFCLAAVAIFATAPAYAAEYAAALAAVINHMSENDYPEVFADKPYVVKVENSLMFDVDRDGEEELVMHVTPHYRQSATLLFYRVSSDMKVSRLREGLAPGPLLARSGDFLDAHTLGLAVDIDLGEKQQDEVTRKKILDSAFAQNFSVVAYRDFLHMDRRKFSLYYVDMTGAQTRPGTKTCGEFEFSLVKDISSGMVGGLGDEPVLAVWVDKNIYLYRFNAVSAEGMLDKTQWTVKLPPDFAELIYNRVSRPLKYVTSDGKEKPFAVTCETGPQNSCVLK